ncbi:hypothetical protein FXO38_28587 [Capsicum annuum]|nr:hypothetical protein FXO38_28587 [Capsicum annuum]
MMDNTSMNMVTRSILRSDPDVHTVPMFDLGISQMEEEDALPSEEVRDKYFTRFDKYIYAHFEVWLYECCSAVDPKIAIKYANRISRLLNWETTDRRPHFKAFIEDMLANVDNPVAIGDLCKLITDNFKGIMEAIESIKIAKKGYNVEAVEDIPVVSQLSSQHIGTDRSSTSASASYDSPILNKKHPFTPFIGCSYDLSIENKYLKLIKEGLLTTHERKKDNEDHFRKHKSNMLVLLQFGVELKKGTYSPPSNFTYTTVDCVFKIKVEELWEKYVDPQSCTYVVHEEYVIREYMNEYRLIAGVPWHTVNHVLILLHVKERFHWVLVVVLFLDRRLYNYDSYNFAIHDVYVKTEVQKFAGVIPSSLLNIDFYKKKMDIDWQCHPKYRNRDESDPFEECDIAILHTRYVALLWNYGRKKKESGTASDDEAPAKMQNPSLIRTIARMVSASQSHPEKDIQKSHTFSTQFLACNILSNLDLI